MNPRNKNTIKTIPDSAYEGGITPEKNKQKKANPPTLTTDLQNNGYPLSRQNKIHTIPLDEL